MKKLAATVILVAVLLIGAAVFIPVFHQQVLQNLLIHQLD